MSVEENIRLTKMDPTKQKAVTSVSREDTDSSGPHQSIQKSDEQEAGPQTASIMPAQARPHPVFSDLVSPRSPFVFQMDLLSPSKVLDISMDCSPCYKRPAADNHTGLTPGISELQPTRAKRFRRSDPSLPEDAGSSVAIDSPIRQRKLPKSKTDPNILENKSGDFSFAIPPVPRSLFESKSAKVPSTSTPCPPKELFNSNSDLRPCKLFTDSPNISSSDIEAMMDEIDVIPMDNGASEDFLRKRTLRRCRSLDLRKQLSDMSNTPTSSFKKSFKKPHPKDIIEKEESAEEGCKEEPQHEPENAAEEINHERIKIAVDVLQSQSLIADGSRNYCLPVIPGKHSDLKNLQHDTLASLLNYPYKSLIDIDKLTVIDCRYPYEYTGGHIKGAINIYTEEAMTTFLQREIEEPSSSRGKHILIFHCEFSSQRGPNLLRHLRNCDRQQNAAHYPRLTFPEVYCLFGGYKEFFHQHPDLCEPSGYTPMADEKYASDLRHFRAKAKSWAAGEKMKAMKKL